MTAENARAGESTLKSLRNKIKGISILLAIAGLTCVTAAAGQSETRGNNEFALFSPAKGVWYTNSSDGCAFAAVRWGTATDRLVPADYDGDGQIDAAVWRPASGTWFIRRSSDAKAQIVNFGGYRSDSGDVPVPADYDGDGKAEIAVWRPTTGEWIYGSDGKRTPVVFGVAGDVPVPADYDGDGRADLGVFRGSDSRWMILQSSDGTLRSVVFGNGGQQTLVPADYTGDGKADLAVYSAGKWLVLSSETGEAEPFVFGFDDDIAAPGDYDGDGTADFAVYRKGTWYIYESRKPKFRTFEFGNADDVPLNSALTRKSFSP